MEKISIPIYYGVSKVFQFFFLYPLFVYASIFLSTVLFDNDRLIYLIKFSAIGAAVY